MTSLAEAYGGRVGMEVSTRRLYLGLGLFLSGSLLTAAGVIVASTDLLTALGLVDGRMSAWRRAGVLAGLGVPAVIAGVFSVLPSSRRIKAAATIGASISVLGVALFWYAYPIHWAGYGREFTLPVTGIFFFGMTTSVWCLFVGIANFKRRNDPGGTVSLRITKGGETRVVEVPRSALRSQGVEGVGGVGVFGSGPDGEVETQTGGPSSASGDSKGERTATATTTGTGTDTGTESGTRTTDETAATASRDRETRPNSGDRRTTTSARAAGAGAASDGGADDEDIRSLNAGGEVVGATEAARDLADRYCGNCEQFRYVRSEDGMQPYCGYHGEIMGDMEACEQWEPNH